MKSRIVFDLEWIKELCWKNTIRRYYNINKINREKIWLYRYDNRLESLIIVSDMVYT